MQRLKTRNQFQAVLAGNTVARTVHFALHSCGLEVSALAPAPEASSVQAQLFGVKDVWVGAMVPKRWARRAVTRNTIKRQIYSVSNHFETVLPKAALVVRLRAGFDRSQFKSATSDRLKKTVRAELEQLLAQVAGPIAKALA